MSEDRELLERLRKLGGAPFYCLSGPEAADRITTLLNRVSALEEALETIRNEPPVNYDSSLNAERIIRLCEIANAALEEPKL